MRHLAFASLSAVVILAATASAALPDDMLPPPKPHVGFYVVHPRVGLSTYFSLSSSWAGTQAPVRAVAKIHRAGETCGATPQSDTGTPLGSAWLKRANHHTVWKEWTPSVAGAYNVCTWLGDPAIATGATPLLIEPRSAGVTQVGSLVAALTSKSPDGPARAVFPTAPHRVYARFALRGVHQGRRVTIEFRDTNGHVVLKRARSSGPGLTWFSAHVDHQRIAQRLGYWLVSVRVGGKTLGRVHFIVPAY
jgi:hypothetical protein